MKLLLLAALVGAATAAQLCQPQTYYILRHSERYVAYLPGPLEAPGSSVLRERGVQRANDLRDMFQGPTQVLPAPNAIIVSPTDYTYQTSKPLALALAIPTHTIPPEGTPMLERIQQLNPCPQTALIVTHGARIRAVFATLNYDGPIPDDVSQYGRFYAFGRNATGGLDMFLADTYPFNDPGSGSPLPAPCIPAAKVDKEADFKKYTEELRRIH